MKRLLILFALMLQAGGNSVNIPITPNWQFSGDAHAYGTNGCYIMPGAKCYQVLSKSPYDFQPQGTLGFYTVTLFSANHFFNYPGYITARISFGTQELCDDSSWAEGLSTQVSFICTSPGYIIIDQTLPEDGGPATGPAQGKQPFTVTVSVRGGWQATFDHASMTFTPQS